LNWRECASARAYFVRACISQFAIGLLANESILVDVLHMLEISESPEVILVRVIIYCAVINSKLLKNLFYIEITSGLSASTIARLKEAWLDEHARWLDRDLSAKQ
jgi:hypothetical protein